MCVSVCLEPMLGLADSELVRETWVMFSGASTTNVFAMLILYLLLNLISAEELPLGLAVEWSGVIFVKTPLRIHPLSLINDIFYKCNVAVEQIKMEVCW